MSLLNKLFSPTHIVALQKITQAVTGLGTALMVAHFMSPEEQGYFYTLGSLLSGYIILDLGFSSYLLQKSAQLSNGLIFDRQGEISPVGVQRDQFIAFSAWVFKWYRNAGVLALLILGPIGAYVLAQNGSNQTHTEWFWPWVLVVVAIAISMPSIGLFALMEGAGSIREVYLLRIAHYMIGALLAWWLIFSKLSLYAQAMPIIATAAVCYGWYFWKYRTRWNSKTISNKHAGTVGILPQIKYTTSIWLANYIFLNAPIILSFVSGDLISTGQLGLSIVIANVGGAIAMSRVTAHMPEIIRQISSGEYKSPSRIFQSSLAQFGVLYASGGIVLVSAAFLFDSFKIFSRLLDPVELSLLLLAFLFFHTSNSCSLYLRALGYSRFQIYSLIAAIAIVPLSLFSRDLNDLDIILSMCVSNLPIAVISILALRQSTRSLNPE